MYLCDSFQHNTDLGSNCRKYGEISQVLVEDSLCLTKISKKISRNGFFSETRHKNLDWIWDKTRQILDQTDEYSFTHEKKSNSFTHKRTFLSALAVMNRKFNPNPVGRISG